MKQEHEERKKILRQQAIIRKQLESLAQKEAIIEEGEKIHKLNDNTKIETTNDYNINEHANNESSDTDRQKVDESDSKQILKIELQSSSDKRSDFEMSEEVKE